MTNPLSRKDKFLSILAVIFLILSGGSTAQPGRLPATLYAKSTTFIAPVSLTPSGSIPPPGTNALTTSGKAGDNSSRFIHTEKNSDLVISIPDAACSSYRVIFFEQDHFLFEISVPREPYLIMEKNNFRHAGSFRYELFRDGALVERNNFIIKND